MTTRTTETINSLAAFLRGCARGGIWNNPEAYETGVPIAFEDGHPVRRLPLAAAEQRIAEMPDDADALRQKVQLRFGFAPYTAWASQRRDHQLDDLYDATPDSQRGVAYNSPSVARGETDELARAAARAILNGALPPEPYQYDYTRDLYLRSIALPPGNVGEVTEVHRRVIRSNVHGLRTITVHQTEHWNSSLTADAMGMGGVTITTGRQRRSDRDGVKGERLDLTITFPELDPEDDPRELTWIRTRRLESGWLPENRTFVFSSTPDRPTLEMVIEVKFGAGAPPQTVLKFSDVYDGDRDDADLAFEVVHAKDGAIRCTWSNPAVGLASGIRIAW